MTVDSLVYAIPSGSPHTSTNTTSTVRLNSCTSELPFWNMKDRTVDSDFRES